MKRIIKYAHKLHYDCDCLKRDVLDGSKIIGFLERWRCGGDENSDGIRISEEEFDWTGLLIPGPQDQSFGARGAYGIPFQNIFYDEKSMLMRNTSAIVSYAIKKDVLVVDENYKNNLGLPNVCYSGVSPIKYFDLVKDFDKLPSGILTIVADTPEIVLQSARELDVFKLS